ncbi:hypothetical protein ACFC9N_10830 [Enterococcus casseliflavus]|uniref:hypothetical protein n=2 Tax=Enterococcus TaxID=1350 RepID=UPI000A3D29AE|nr:hypothetical protein [Enterococcus sp. 4E1_DIV0656]OTO09170.1 hypothetical protein A5882_003500 [Enterococcus sp. 4E1_DIV0656]
MKRMLWIAIFLSVFILSGCKSETEVERNNLREEINELQVEKEELSKTISSLSSANDFDRYIVVVEVGQEHYSIDIEDMMKDSMNRIEIAFPVDKAYYDAVQVGDVIDNSFRAGSFFTKGSYGSWDISITDKYIE